MNQRAPLLQHLRAYRDRWPAETAMTDRLIDFVESNPACFERSLAVGHITGSAWLVNLAGTHVLLTHHKKLDMWLQLGGHVDGKPDTLEAARREAREESGISGIEPASSDIFDVDIHRIPARKDEPAHDHHDIRHALRVTDQENYVVGGESHALAWVEIARLQEYTNEESMLRMARKWLNP